MNLSHVVDDDVEYVIITAPITASRAPNQDFSTNRRDGMAAAGGRVDLALAAWLVLLPLLPAGPAYLGWVSVSYVDLAVPLLILLWAWGRLEARGRQPLAAPLAMLPWHLTVAAAAGAAVMALMAEHRLDSRVFVRHVRDAASELWRPMNQGSHPFYPLRVAITCIEGWLVVLLVTDLWRRAADPGRRVRTALAGWLCGLGLVSAGAILQYFTKFQLHPYWVKANPHIVRAHSTLDDPNALGAFLVLGIGLLTGLLLLGEAARRRWWAGLLGLAILALGSTMSRAAVGAAIVAPLAVLALALPAATAPHRAVRRRARLALTALLLLVIGSSALRWTISEQTRTQPGNPSQLVIGTLDPRESTNWVLRGRIPWWRAAVGMFRDHPFTGVGLGRYPREMGAYGGGRTPENAHNFFLQQFAETGLLGGALFIALCIHVGAAFGRGLRLTASGTRAAALGGLIGTLGFVLTLLTGHSLLLPSGQMLWGSFIAVVTGVVVTASGAPAESSRAVRPSAARWLPAVSLLCVFLWFPAAAAIQGVTPRLGAWGYSWGLFDEEGAPGGVPYRWTSEGALIDLDLPARTTHIELSIAAPNPIRDGVPVRVRMAAADWADEAELATAEVRTLRIPVQDAAAGAPGRLAIAIDVDPPFVPARHDPQSRDQRVLGVQLLPLRFVTSAGADSRH